MAIQHIPRRRLRPGGASRTFAAARCALVAGAVAAAPASAAGAEVLPDGITSHGTRDVAAAWLVEPTTRYAHGVLGDAVEAAGLAVLDAAGRRHLLRLPAERVFEDRLARLADLDHDGRDEIIVVESDARRGARLSVFGLGAHGIEPRAATPFIGRPHRWLNPAGIADFHPRPGLEIALVERPHLAGVLELWSYEPAAGALVRLASAAGFSNHAIGRRALGLSAVVPHPQTGRHAALLLPRFGRRALALVAFSGESVRVLEEIALDAPVSRDFRRNGAMVAVEDDGGGVWRRRFD